MAASSSFSGLLWVFLLFSLLLAVLAQFYQPTIGRPSGRVDSGALANFTCRASGFLSPDITVTWTKNQNQIEASLPAITLEIITYRVVSTLQVSLTKEDIHSTLTCYIDYSSFGRALQQSFDLGNVLRVAPRVTVETSDSSPIPLNRSVKLTCIANNFYPNDISVAWWRSDYHDFTERANNGKPNLDGTFSLRLLLSTQKSRDSTINYTCQVIHNSQSPIYVTRALRFGMQPGENISLFLLSNSGLWIGLLLGKIASALLLLYLLLRKSASTIAELTQKQKHSAK